MVSPFIVMIYAAHFLFTCPLLCQSSVPGIIDIFSIDFIAHQMKTPIRVKTFLRNQNAKIRRPLNVCIYVLLVRHLNNKFYSEDFVVRAIL